MAIRAPDGANKVGYSFVLPMIWSWIFSGIIPNVGRQLNEKQLSLSGISNSLTESSKFHKMRTFPRQSKRCMLCQYLSKQTETGYEFNISGLVIQMSKSFISHVVSSSTYSSESG